MRRRGKRAGALVKLRQRGFRTPLPSIHLTNLRSLPNKTNSFCSPGQIRISQTPLLCVSRKPGWMTQYRTVRYICRIYSWSDLIAMKNQRGNHAAVGCVFTSMRGGVQMCCSDLKTLFNNCKPFYGFVRSFSWVSLFLRKRTWAQLYRNLLIWSQTQNKNPRTRF